MSAIEKEPTAKSATSKPITIEISHTPTWAYKGALQGLGKFFTRRSVTTLSDEHGMPVTDANQAREIARRIASLNTGFNSTTSTRILQLP